MPDDKDKTGKPDDIRINVNEPYEVEYWKEKLKITPERLREVVKVVGPMVDDVKRKLGEKE